MKLFSIKHCLVIITLTGIFLSGCAGAKSASSETAERPMNFLFILVDDLGIRDIGVEGSKFYETPHIDRLANSGMRFTQGYANCRVCSPSRASIMTGKYTPRHGVTDWIGAATGLKWNRNDKVVPASNADHLPHDDISLAEAMREGGYATFFAGKWHLGDKGSAPEDHGFDINIGGWRAGSPAGGYFAPFKNPALERLGDIRPGKSLPILLARETAKFIEKSKDKKFFAYLSFYSVHGPVQTSRQLWRKYRDKAQEQGLASSRFIFDRTRPVRQVQDHPIYGGMMETLDDAVGIVINKLTALGLDKNTVVIFTGDNGGVSSGDAYCTSNLPYRGGKGRQWEGGVREPYYIVAPGIARPGGNCVTPVMGADFYPTILELAQLPAKPRQHLDGVSLVKLLQGKEIDERDLFWHYPHYGNQGGEPSAVIRSGAYKLIHYYEDGRDELYHLSSDIGEQKDLAAVQPQRRTALRKKLDDWLAKTGAIIPQPDKRFDAQKKSQQLKKGSTDGVRNFEKQHARFLDPDWQPNKTWWDSMVTKD